MTSTKLLAHSGLLATITITPTIQAASYVPGDLVGGKIELLDAVKRSGGGGMFQNMVLTDLSSQGRTVDVILFDADPAGTTFTERTAFDVSDDDISKVIGAIRCDTKIDIGVTVGIVRDLA